jgi:O-antigen ligase
MEIDHRATGSVFGARSASPGQPPILRDDRQKPPYDASVQKTGWVDTGHGVLGGARTGLISLGLSSSVVLAALAVISPKYVFVVIAGVAFVMALVIRPALGLALFTLMTFFGELGHGASPAKAAGALLVLFWFLQIMRRDRTGAPFLGWTRPQIFYFAVGVVLWSACSLLWATDAATARTTAFRLALNVMLFIVVPSFASTRKDLLLILYAYVFGAALTAVYGVATGNSQTNAVGRLAGGIGDPNELAALLVPAIVLAFLLIPMSRSLGVRLALVLSIGVAAFAMVLAQSRGGILAIVAAAVAGIVWGGKRRGAIFLGTLVAVACVVSYVFLSSAALGRFSSFGGGGTGRIDTWSVALRMFRDHPVNGVGIGNFTVVEPRYAAGNIDLTRVDLVLDLHKVTHNTYLNILADLGLVGLALFAGLVFFVLRALRRRIRQAASSGDTQIEAIGRGLLIALIGLLVAYTFISAQYEKQLWLLLGLGLAAANLRQADGVEEEAEETDAPLMPVPRMRVIGPAPPSPAGGLP